MPRTKPGIGFLLVASIGWALPPAADAHQPITTKVTWNKELSRIFAKSCAGCHTSGGTAFPLETYEEARAWATAIRDEVLEERMPPWPPAKGFGDFENDRSLTPFEIELIVSWAEGGVPRGDPKDLPATPSTPATPPPVSSAEAATAPAGRLLMIQRPLVLKQPVRAVAVRPFADDGAPVEVRAIRPDGSRETLVWIRAFQSRHSFTYRFREPVALPRGARLEVRGGGGAGAEVTIAASGSRHRAARRAP